MWLNTLYVVYTVHSQWLQKLWLDAEQVHNQFGCDSAAVNYSLTPVFGKTSVVVCTRQVILCNPRQLISGTKAVGAVSYLNVRATGSKPAHRCSNA